MRVLETWGEQETETHPFLRAVVNGKPPTSHERRNHEEWFSRPGSVFRSEESSRVAEEILALKSGMDLESDCSNHFQVHRTLSEGLAPCFTKDEDIMLSEALRLLRVFHDMKLGELAKELDLSPSHLSEIENGKKTPSLEVISKYAEFFETTPSAILFFGEQLDEKKDLRSKVKGKFRSSIIGMLQSLERLDNEIK